MFACGSRYATPRLRGPTPWADALRRPWLFGTAQRQSPPCVMGLSGRGGDCNDREARTRSYRCRPDGCARTTSSCRNSRRARGAARGMGDWLGVAGARSAPAGRAGRRHGADARSGAARGGRRLPLRSTSSSRRSPLGMRSPSLPCATVSAAPTRVRCRWICATRTRVPRYRAKQERARGPRRSPCRVGESRSLVVSQPRIATTNVRVRLVAARAAAGSHRAVRASGSHLSRRQRPGARIVPRPESGLKRRVRWR